MKQDNSRNRTYLVILLAGILVLNAGYAGMMFQVTGSDIEKFDDIITDISKGEADTSKELYVPTEKGMRRFTADSDRQINFFQKSIGFLAIANIVFVFVMIMLFLFRSNNADEDR